MHITDSVGLVIKFFYGMRPLDFQCNGTINICVFCNTKHNLMLHLVNNARSLKYSYLKY